MKHRLLYLILILFFPIKEYAQGIYINEFLSSNVSINADIVDFDDYSDWIELYNDEDYDVDIGNWFISDNLNTPTKFQFPEEVIIPPKGYLLLWADGFNEIPGQTYRRDYFPNDYFTTKYFHLSFNLSRAGEEIALFNSDTVLVDSVSFGLQQRDISMGRKPDGSDNWIFFGEPTPDTLNYAEGTLKTDFSESPLISHKSGFYDSPISVTIAPITVNSSIYYTLDGSRPTSKSLLYEYPISISNTTSMRIRVFETDKLPSRIFTYSYFLNEETELSTISITAYPEMLWGEEKGIYDNQYKGVEIPVTVDYFEAGGGEGFSIDCGLKMSGQASLDYPQKSVTIYARDRYGKDAIEYQVFPDRVLNTFKSLYLRNAGVPDNRLTMFRDAALHKIVLNKMDIDAQAYVPAVLFLNGEYWGIYNIRDKITNDYLASTHNINPDDIDLLEYNNSRTPEVMSGSANEFNELIQFFEKNDLSIEENYDYIQSKIDIEEYINYYITEIYYNNPWWLKQNVRMWKEQKEDARWRWILFDTDAAFGFSSYEQNNLAIITSPIPNTQFTSWSTLTFRKLLTNNEFKIKFIQRFSSYINSVFHPDTVISIINSSRNDISNEMPRHISRWRSGGMVNQMYPIQNMFEWEMNINEMKRYAFKRPEYQRNHIMSVFSLSGNSELEVILDDENMGFVVVNNFEKVVQSDTNIYFNDIPTILKAVPKVGYRFVRWEGLSNSIEDSIEIILNNNAQITAVFEPEEISMIPSIILADLSLTSENSPYFIDKDVIVNPNITLTINEGVEILVSEDKNIKVNGCLMINGTMNNPVTIKSNENSESWGALIILNATDSCSISNLILEDATHGQNFTRDKAALSIHNSVVSIDGLDVQNVQMPIYVEYGKAYIKNSSLYTPFTGDLINVKYAEFALVENCVLRGNDEYDTDAIDYDQMKSGTIRGNRIFNFYGSNSDAIDLGENSKDILIEANTIYNINDKGISIGHGSNGIIKRNLIANCGQGVGIKDFYSYGYIEHNTFYGNNYGVACFVKNIGMGGGTAEVTNTIIANSKSSSIFIDDLSTINISYSLSNTNDLAGINNVYADPKYLNEYRLSSNSPAIDMGNPAVSTDPDGSFPDIGAFFYDTDDQQNLIINEIHYTPSEGESFEFIELVNAGKEIISLAGYQISGSISHDFDSYELNPDEYLVITKSLVNYSTLGNNVFQWDDGTLPDNYGVVEIRDAGGKIIDRVDYENKYWWPSKPNGNGHSLELHENTLENMVSTSWRSSYEHGGTPGKHNTIKFVDKLFINEFLASNSRIKTDENGEYDDWIEIYNGTNNEINVGGLYITDNFENLLKYQIPFHSSDETIITPFGKLLLWADGQPNQGILHIDFKLDKEGEQLGLVQINGSDTLIVDSLTFGEQLTDISFGRYPDGSNNWFSFEKPTPLDSNIITSVAYESTIPDRFYLSQNYPNPFNPLTTIKYTIPSSPVILSEAKNLKDFSSQTSLNDNMNVKLKVFDILGREIAILVHEKQKPGNYQVEFNSHSGSVRNLTSGIYFYRITAGKYIETKKMILLK